MAQNPPWVRDELILALDLYFQFNRKHPSKRNPAVVELSNFLKNLPLHLNRADYVNFRSPSAVTRKLANFGSIDPDYPTKGMPHINSLDQVIWEEFHEDLVALHATARSIRKSYNDPEIPQLLPTELGEEREEFVEGRILTALHKKRERNLSAVKAKKKKILHETGNLACEVCSFDFYKVYGEIGRDFAECHHIIPLSQLGDQTTTRLDDLAIVCANCHRMLHRGKRLLSISELFSLLG